MLSTASNLSSMAEETTASMTQVSLAVTEISQGANNLAKNSQDTATDIGQLSERLDNIEQVTKDMNNVSQDTKELSKQGIDTVNILITKNSETMEASTEEVTSTMEQFTQHTSELQDLAEKLKTEIDKFKI